MRSSRDSLLSPWRFIHPNANEERTVALNLLEASHLARLEYAQAPFA